MAKWTFKKSPKSDKIYISKEDKPFPKTLLGNAPTAPTLSVLHCSLIETASFFQPGDIVETPEGACIVKGPEGELNN
jgi:hypothetical protein